MGISDHGKPHLYERDWISWKPQWRVTWDREEICAGLVEGLEQKSAREVTRFVAYRFCIVYRQVFEVP